MRGALAVLAILAALAGCIDDDDPGGPWQDVATLTGPLAPEVGPPPADRAPPSCTLRIATWNVHFGGDPDDLAARLRASPELASADVLFVQEIEAYPGEPGSRARRLATALGMTWIYAPARPKGDGTHGIAILSRYPLAAAAVRALPFIDRPLHPAPRIALAADVVLGARRLRVVDIHLDTRLSPGERIGQLAPAVHETGDALVAGGDLNTQPWPWVDGLVPVTSTEAVDGQSEAAIVDAYLAELGFAGAVPPSAVTMRVPAFDMRLDNLYARGYAIAGAGVAHVDGSDHWPVWFDLAWAACADTHVGERASRESPPSTGRSAAR